jgi:uncharacterized membrane protein YjfL (UPF0719 family)
MSLFLSIFAQNLTASFERGLLGTILYSVIGIIMCMIGFKVVDWLIPGNMVRQLAEDKNMAVGLVAAAMILGICIIIAAAIAS